MNAPAGILNQPHGLRLSSVARAAVFVLLALGVLFGLLMLGGSTSGLFASKHNSVFNLTDPDSVIAGIVAVFQSLAVVLAHAGAMIGLARGREWGRLLATYAAGIWASSLVFLPVSLGMLFVLYHPHLPAKPGLGLRGVMEALGDRKTSPVGLGRWVVILLAVTAIVFAAGEGWSLLTNPMVDPVASNIVVALFLVLEVATMGVALIGVGRRLDWGLPVAVFACGLTLFSTWGFPFGLLVLLVLLNHAGREMVAA